MRKVRMSKEKQWNPTYWEYKESIIYRCDTRGLYHRKLSLFYSKLERLKNLISLCLGIFIITKQDVIPAWVFGYLLLFTTFPSFIFNWTEKSQHHEHLASKFFSLKADVDGYGVLNANEVSKFKEKLALIDADEGKPLTTLTKICANEIAEARGESKYSYKINIINKMFAYFV